MRYTDHGLREVNDAFPGFFARTLEFVGAKVRNIRVVTQLNETFYLDGDDLVVENTTPFVLEAVVEP